MDRHRVGILRLAVAALATASLACSGSGVDLQAERGAVVTSAGNGQTDSDGPVATVQLDGTRLRTGGEASEDDSGGEAGGTASAEDEPEWFTPYEERVYPLAEFIGELTEEVFPETLQHHLDPMAALEEMTYSCMTAQGFRYEMVDWAAIDAEIDAAMPDLTDEEVMTRWGYGFAESLDAPAVIETTYVDPNDAIKAGLSPRELGAWERQWEECHGRADAELDRPLVITWALRDDKMALRDQISSDPRVVQALVGWSDCMAEHGHRYASRDAVFAYLDSIAGPLQDRLMALGGPGNIDAAFQADLDALLAIEIEIATADVACSKRLHQVVYEVTVEHEQRFLDDNEDRLALLSEELPTMTLPNAVWRR